MTAKRGKGTRGKRAGGKKARAADTRKGRAAEHPVGHANASGVKGEPRAHRARGTGSTADHAPALPTWLPFAVYAVVTIVLFREFFFGDAILFGTDTYELSYVAREFYTDAVRSRGTFPLWDPLLFGGLPFVDGMHGDIFYPPSLALFFLDARAMWGWKMVLHVFAAGCFTYLWLRGLRLSKAAAFFGGLVFMAGPDLVSLVYPGGDGKLFVSALAPLMFWLTDRAVRRHRVGDYAAFSLGLALVIFTSHMQLAYFTVWGVSLYFLFRVGQAWRTDRETGAAARRVGMFAVAGVVAVMAAAIQVLPPLQYLREWSQRADRTVQAQSPAEAYAFSTTWSLHPEEVASLVVPEFVGDNVERAAGSGNTYWGRNQFKLNHEYAGLVPLLLLPLLLVRRRTAETWFFVVLGLLAVLYGLGANTPFFRLFYLIPGVSLFRAPSLTIFLYGLSVATLGAYGLDRLLSWLNGTAEEQRIARRTLWITAGAFGLLMLLASGGAIVAIWRAIFAAPMAMPGRPDTLPVKLAAAEANKSNIQAGFFISFLLAAGVAGAAELGLRKMLGAGALVGVLAALAALDSYRVDRTFIRGSVVIQQYQDPALFEPDESIRFLQARQAEGEVFRVFNGAYPRSNTLAAHGLEQAAGHHGNEIGRYSALISAGLVNLLNVEYVVLEPDPPFEDDQFEQVFVGGRSIVYRNLAALPRAFLAGSVRVVPDAQALPALVQPGFDYTSAVLLPQPLPEGINVTPGAGGTVEWQSRELNASSLRVVADAPALLVVTDNYYPAWRVWVDDEPAPLLRANYAFRAVPVPAGEHVVRFEYSAATLRRPALVSAGTIIALALLVVLSAVRARRRPGRNAGTEEPEIAASGGAADDDAGPHAAQPVDGP